MIEAVFISDLHLHPNEPKIFQRFVNFVDWACDNVKSVYILGDFFHVWSGDDSLESWSEKIALKLLELKNKGIKVYFMHGNRDFLLGQTFALHAGMHILPDPTVIKMNGERVLLTHGDRYCKNDRIHQWMIRLTRNRVFCKLFLLLPLSFRRKIVAGVRNYSKSNARKSMDKMEIVSSSMISEMRKMQVNITIHGHIHRPGLMNHNINHDLYQQYVLSDWDDKVTILCYYKASGFSFMNI